MVTLRENYIAKVRALRSKFMSLPDKQFDHLLKLYHDTAYNLEYNDIKKMVIDAVEDGDRRKLWILLMNIWDQSEKNCNMTDFIFNFGFEEVFPYDWFDPTLLGWDSFPEDVMGPEQG